MLQPARAEVARHLEQYRAWERRMLASPDNHAVRGNFEDTGYTLCVLMGKRCAREAVDAAELYLNTRQPRTVRDRYEQRDPRQPPDRRERTVPGTCPAPSANV